MATIRQTLSLYDGISGPLRNINSALHTVLATFQSMQSAADRPIDTAAIDAAVRNLDAVDASFRRIEEEINYAQRAQSRFTEEVAACEPVADSLTGSFARMASALGLVKVAQSGIDMIRSGIDYASDLTEVQNVVDVTFGNSASVINRWSKTALAAYGMNEVSAKRFTGTLGAMMKSAGLAGNSVADMSMKLTGLAGDMASFYNKDLGEAFNKIRSGISGETEPLKEFGIDMSVAKLEAYAMAQGIDASFQSMSQAEQVMLRYNYLLSATADAQGDFARTQDSWANQTRMLSESWLEFKGILANSLLPALTLTASVLNSLVGFAQEHSTAITAALAGITTGVGALTAAFMVHITATKILTAANRQLITTILTSPFTWVAVGISVVISWLYKWIQSVGGIRNAWEVTKSALLTAWAGIKYGFYSGVYFVIDLGETLSLAWKQFTTQITNAAGDMMVNVLSHLQNMLNGAIGMLNDFISLLNYIPGVNIDAIATVTFGTRAALEHEAAVQARNNAYAAASNKLAADRASREAILNGLRNEMTGSAAATAAMYNGFKDQSIPTSVMDSASLAAEGPAAGVGSDLKNLIGNTADTAENTGKLVTNTSKSSEELKLLREMAERSAAAQYTIHNVKVDMVNHNNINSEMDLDGIVRHLETTLETAMYSTPEGVHI